MILKPDNLVKTSTSQTIVAHKNSKAGVVRNRKAVCRISRDFFIIVSKTVVSDDFVHPEPVKFAKIIYCFWILFLIKKKIIYFIELFKSSF